MYTIPYPLALDTCWFSC